MRTRNRTRNPLRFLFAKRFAPGVDRWGVVRVLAYALAVSLFFSFFTMRSVLADGRESALRVGRDLLSLADVLGSPQLAVLNGVRVFVAAQHVDSSVDQVLDRFDRYCQEHSGHFEADIAALPDAERARTPFSLEDLRRFGIARVERGGDEGVVACIAAPEGASGIEGFVARIGEVAETGDLARFGQLRYVFAKKSGAIGSSVITIWNEGPVKVLDVFPGEGDVPGSDLEGVPRPAGSTRVFDAQIPGTGFGMRSYAMRDSQDRAMVWFEQALLPLGWQIGPSPDREAMPDIEARAFVRDGAVLFVSVERDQGETLAHVITMGSRGDVEVPWRPHAEKGRKP
jgi:hypothetical protein